MIRLPLTTISLKPRDIKDYEKRQRRRQNLEIENFLNEFPPVPINSSRDRIFGKGKQHTDHHQGRQKPSERPLAKRIFSEPILMAVVVGSPYCISDSNNDSTVSGEEETLGEISDRSESFLEDGTQEFQRSPTQPEEDVRSNSFQSPGFEEGDESDIAFTSIGPNDESTPQQFHEHSRFRHKFPPPRSPLYHSEVAPSSPERASASEIRPQGTLRAAAHSTPGILFGTPPRRPPKKMRHQSNSFSFDSSERASATYEQERVTSGSTDCGADRQADDISLHEELRGSSLQSSRSGSRASMLSRPGRGDNEALQKTHLLSKESFSIPEEVEVSEVEYSSSDDGDDFNTALVSSSPRLPLPPPFSAVARSCSESKALPSPPGGEYSPVYPATSPLRSPSLTPNRSVGDGKDLGQRPSPPVGQQSTTRDTSPSPRSRMSPRAFAQRILSSVSVRMKSPLSRGRTPDRGVSSPAVLNRQNEWTVPPEHSPSRSPPLAGTPDQMKEDRSITPQTPPRQYQIYDDAISPTAQPQTPANLPEARHQSRYHPSYTAPTTRSALRRAVEVIDNNDGGGIEGRNLLRQTSLSIPTRTGRSHSPPGLRGDGFRGLYGGRENGDDEQNWVDGVRTNSNGVAFSNAEEDEANGIMMRETPEPEEWRVGRRGLY